MSLYAISDQANIDQYSIKRTHRYQKRKQIKASGNHISRSPAFGTFSPLPADMADVVPDFSFDNLSDLSPDDLSSISEDDFSNIEINQFNTIPDKIIKKTDPRQFVQI